MLSAMTEAEDDDEVKVIVIKGPANTFVLGRTCLRRVLSTASGRARQGSAVPVSGFD